MSKDIIFIRNFVFFANHGVHAEERALGQKFRLSLQAETDFTRAAELDRLEETVCYKQLISDILSLSRERNFHTLESLAESLTTRIFNHHARITALRLNIEKPSAAIDAVFDGVGVEIYRTRPTIQCETA